jgi:arabinofuranosyltransferase
VWYKATQMRSQSRDAFHGAGFGLARAALAVSAVALLLAFVQTAWVGEDAYITWRTVDHAVRGYGLTWNAGERVQAYTHPLWMLALLPMYAVTREVFVTTIVLSLLCVGATHVRAAVFLRRVGASPLAPLCYAAVLISSKAFADYSSSGLENPMSFAWAMFFFATFIEQRDEVHAGAPRPLRWLTLFASLAFLTRADTVLVYAPALGYAALRAFRANRKQAVLGLALGGLPTFLWSTGSVIYYGFPFPNTAYSKLGGAAPWFHRHAWLYFKNSIEWDRATLLCIAGLSVAVLVGAGRAKSQRALLVVPAGIALYLAYLVRIGGDYMSGRFFALPLLLSVLAFVAWSRRPVVLLGVALSVFAFGLSGPRSPLRMGREPPTRDTFGESSIRDERASYHNWFSVLGVAANRSDTKEQPLVWGALRVLVGAVPGPQVHTNYTYGAVQADRPKALIWGAIGGFGIIAGPDVHVVDPIGLPDPVLARLAPRDVEAGWGRGHLFRDIPVGYVTSIDTGYTVMRDANIADYHRALANVTRGDLFRWDRFRDIWALNLGHYRKPPKRHSP